MKKFYMETPLLNRQTDTTENITFPETTWMRAHSVAKPDREREMDVFEESGYICCNSHLIIMAVSTYCITKSPIKFCFDT